jgi:NAD+ kinase
MYPCFERLVRGEYLIEERMMLEAQVIREGQVLNVSRALNDVVVNKGPLSRIITLDAYINGQFFSTFRGDGLIIATPTGSTAYSLSAGGPIVSPEVEMILLTPICPHTFYTRPLIISPAQHITVVLKPRFDEVAITLDGQHGFRLKAGDEVVVSRSSYRTRLVKVRGRHFFELIRDKLTIPSLLLQNT